MAVAILLPIILPVLGSFLAPFLFIAGVVAVMISKVTFWIRLSTVILIVGALVLFWKQYEAAVMNFMPAPMEQ